MSRKNARPDEVIAEVAERQHGVVSTGQLVARGVREHSVLRRARVGRLHRVYQGVYAVGHLALPAEAKWMAAVLACGSGAKQGADHGDSNGGRKSVLAYWGAALSHRSAAELWRLLPARKGLVDVSVPGDGGRSKRRGIRLHRSLTLLPASVTLREGIPVTSPARTIADLRSAVRRRATDALSEAELRRAIRQAAVLGLPVDEETRRERTRSDLERDFLRLCRQHNLPEPEVNARVGRHLVDFLWSGRKLIVETDGYRYHRGRAAFEDDRRRDLDLRSAGYEVMHIADRQLDDEPDGIVRVLRERLRHGAP